MAVVVEVEAGKGTIAGAEREKHSALNTAGLDPQYIVAPKIPFIAGPYCTSSVGEAASMTTSHPSQLNLGGALGSVSHITTGGDLVSGTGVPGKILHPTSTDGNCRLFPVSGFESQILGDTNTPTKKD